MNTSGSKSSRSAQSPGKSAILAAIQNDTGPCQLLGKAFTIQGEEYTGRAVATTLAVYLVKQRAGKPGAARLAQAMHGSGVIGSLLNGSSAARETPATCLLTELPPALKSGIDPDNEMGNVPILIIPKNVVSHFRAPFINTFLTLSVGDQKIKILADLFAFSTRRRLRKSGWQLNT